jgi:DNA-binding GntR family transcriptional regulator
VAKYPQVRDKIKARLLSGRYREGRALPSEQDLAGEFVVSRMTVRRALGELVEEGYLVREQGSGTYPTGRHFSQGAFRVVPLEELAGDEPVRTRVLSAGLVVAPREVAKALSIEPGTAVVLVERLRSIGVRPVLVERRYLPSDVGEGLIGRNLAGESIHDQLVASLGVRIESVQQALSAVTLEYEIASLLEVREGAAAFLLRRVSNSGTRVVSLGLYWVRGDAGIFTSGFAP